MELPGPDPLPFWQGAYRDHGPAVLAFLRSRLGALGDAEDLLQETFVRAIRAGASVRELGKVRAYLFTIAHRLTLNLRRRPRLVVLADDHAAGRAALDAVAAPGADSPEAAARFEQLERRLAEVVAAMPPGYRRAFELGVLEKRPYREIAARTGWSAAQVKINVYRARRRAMEGLGDFTTGGGKR
jgi:RNA polymerase sigma-70 factor, ECF subfamily